MSAHLDPEARKVVGTAEITWLNSSTAPVPDLQFHLYFNAWRDSRSSFLTAAERWIRAGGRRLPEDWGGIDVTRISVRSLDPQDPRGGIRSSQDLTAETEFIQPDDGNPYDKTVWRVLLQRAVQPGERLQIDLEFETKVPRTFARTGFRGDYFFLAHWFPKLGVLEYDGTWNCHQFIQTEFFSDFSRYDVKLTVPSGWIVGASGREVERRQEGGETTVRYAEDKIHEFAWVTCPRFQEFKRLFHAQGLPSVEMRLLLMPDHLGQQDRYFAATEATLRYYGEWFGPYPYGYVTIVDPAFGSGSGGMEYPTLFTGGTRWWNPKGSGSPEGVTVHECGHQFWYGIVANNEFEDAWLDEGFNTYSTERVMGIAFQPTFVMRRYLHGSVPYLFGDLVRSEEAASGLNGFESPLKRDVTARPAYQYGPDGYRINAYTKPALMLLTLERLLGWDTFQQVLSTYFRRFAFRHPRPADFQRILEEQTGKDFTWFWDETLYSSNVFDYAVEEVATRRDAQEVLVRRWGEAIFPVDIRIVFEGGDEVLEQWDGGDRWHRFRYERPERVTRVQVDPGEVLALDVRRVNNSWIKDAPTRLAARKWASKWTVWFQHMLEFLAFAG